jgi:microcystin-dependent protein
MAIQFTANFQIPYPALDRSDTADVPRDIKAVADKVDQTLLTMRHDELIGEIKIWPIAAAPALFLICDGSLLDRAGTYNKLYQAIGTTFSVAGDDGTKFRLPDGRGRTFFGVDGSAERLSANDALGAAGGKETAPLSVANMPAHAHPDNIAYGAAGAHNHTLHDPGHVHLGEGNTGYFMMYLTGGGISGFMGNGEARAASDRTGLAYTGITIDGVGDHAHVKSGGVQNAGGGTEHPNLPPYLVANYIIRYA